MSKTRMAYFEEGDVLHLAVSDEPEAQSIEISPKVTAELNEKGELIGIEILDASVFVRNSVLARTIHHGGTENTEKARDANAAASRTPGTARSRRAHG